MNICVSYNACEFGDFIRYFSSIHTNQFTKVHWLDPKGSEKYLQPKNKQWGMHRLLIEPNKNIKLTETYNKNSFLKLFEEKCPSSSTHVYKIKTSKENTHNILGTPEYDIIHSLGHKVIFTKLELLSDWGLLLLKRLELLSKVLDEKFDKEWWIKFYQKKRDYPKHHLNHELQIDKLLDYNEDEYNKLVKFLDCKPIDDWKEIVKKYTIWIKKDLDNTA